MTDMRGAVAIIGMAGRFPGAPTLDDFWQNLCAGVESLSEFSAEQLHAAGVPPAVSNLPRYVKAGTVLEGTDLFDPAFFGISPREAEILDPQHRLFLVCAWEAVENGGYATLRSPRSIGVFGGASMNTYHGNVIARNPDVMASAGGYQLMLGNDKDFMTTRVSYKLNLRGPSVVVQTACSTSLVAVQMAYQSLIKHQCDMALAGGSSVYFPQNTGYLYEEGMIFSPDGHCRPFDADGRGIRSGPGAGVVFLKRLTDALADGDTIRAVIRGAAINNDGSNKIGYTAPSVDGQAEVIAMAQALAQTEPETITYIEAHGTGTPLGDPIEIAALTQVFRSQTNKKRFCAVGAVKGNIGHLDAAAGVAGLIKTVLCLEHKAIPPSLNFVTPNPGIDFENGPFFVNTKLSEWPAGATPRRAGVSSFGIGGTNAHLVLEEAPSPEPTEPPDQDHILVLSAKTRPALEEATARMTTHLEQQPDLNVADAAYTLQVGREEFSHRRIVICRDRDDALRALTTGDPQRVLTAGEGSRQRPVVFMFSGQGSQYVNMGRALYDGQAEFRRQFDRCADLLFTHLCRDIRTVLFPAECPNAAPSEAAQKAAAAELNQTSLAQPVLFATEYALAKMWMSWGVEPEAMIGHSIGEYVAACLAGVLSLEDAVALVAARGRLMQSVPAGSMLSVPLPVSEVAAFVTDRVSLAAINGPALCTLSGPTEAIAAVDAELGARGVACRQLHTSHAFHSAMMDPVLAPFRDLVRSAGLQPPQLPFVSNLSGTWITDAEATDPEYWVSHLRQAVHFAQGLEELGRNPDRVFLEVGPGNALGTFARQTLGSTGKIQVLASLPHAQDRQTSDRFSTATLGRLWLSGVPIGWSGVHAGARRRRIPLPTYPFERQRYWVDPAPSAALAGAGFVAPGKRANIGEWFYAPSWMRSAALEPADRGAPPAEGAWLLFMDECGLGEALMARLATHGRTVTSVEIGPDFRQIAPGRYAIAPGDPNHYRLLLAELKAADRMPAWMVHLWNVTASDTRPAAFDTLEQSQTHGFFSLLSLAQAVGHVGVSQPLRVTVVSTGMQSVLSNAEVSCPEKATLLGPCTIIPLEYPGVDCRSVDIELPPAGSAAEGLVAGRLLHEAALERPSGPVAFRAGRRWEQVYEAVRLERPRQAKVLVRSGGVYVITGGTGGLGLVFARSLAATPDVVLILTARSALPPRDEWDAWLATREAADRVAAIVREVRGLEAQGARVEVVRADVADAARMHEVIGDVRRRFGTIHGIIHAAGTPGGGIIQLKTPAAAGGVLDPKVKGTLILKSALQGIALDFFVLCSSINAIYAGPGAVDYCGANAFLDAFAHAQHANGETSVVSINWDTWQEVGMAANAAVPPEMQDAKAHSLRNGISPSEGVEALNRVVEAGLPQTIVSTKDLHLILYIARMARMAERRRDKLVESSAAPVPGQLNPASRHPRPDLPTAYVAPRNDDERQVATIWSGLLGIEEIGIHDNFFELGGHSLLATRVLARLQDSVGVALPLETVFDAPTVAQMTDRIVTLRWVTEGKANHTNGDNQGDREEFEL